jgi:hypothetical protein
MKKEETNMNKLYILMILLLTVMLAGCTPEAQEPEPTLPAVNQQPSPTPDQGATFTPDFTPTPEATPDATPDPTPTSMPQSSTPTPTPDLPAETVMIVEPGSGSRVLSPVTIRGESDPAREQHLGIRIFLADGTLLTESFAKIDAPLGERGPFEAEVEFEIDGEENAFIQVFIRSARDGEITHLSSVGVTFASDGEEEINTREPYEQRILIYEPASPSSLPVVSGGTVRVVGFGLASFEQTLIAEIQDEMGNVIGETSFIVDAPDLGEPGPFSVEVNYEVDTAQRGRVVIRDLSPAFGGDVYVTSVEVQLEP